MRDAGEDKKFARAIRRGTWLIVAWFVLLLGAGVAEFVWLGAVAR